MTSTGITLPMSEYVINNDTGSSYMMSKSPDIYPCYRKTIYMLPTSIVDSFIHQIIFHGTSDINERSGWIISAMCSDINYESVFISMQDFEAVILKLKSRKSIDQYVTLSRWLELTRKLIKDQQYSSIISESLRKDGQLDNTQSKEVRKLYADHGLFPLYLNGAKSVVYFTMNRLLSDIIHDTSASSLASWQRMIERGFEQE